MPDAEARIVKRSHSAALKTVLTAVVLYGVFIVGLPALILQRTGAIPLPSVDIGFLRWLGVPVAGFGFYLYLWAVGRLLRRQTSAIPGIAPSVLVTDGWYGRTRHPLLLGVVLILLSEAVFFSSVALLVYALAYWLWLTLFVVRREEPDLRRTFGEAFDDYCRDVPRWIPRARRDSQSPHSG